ncbi:hypothetical protein NDU88_002236 [Pleurodeles waltl]|uniref:Uncharacterized protein n=1 Tax=Pleurodeles waltl TaxID=8319 RepID=A0AAV7TL90_PLEWA|nr:hypothetical protein NDU88_002236 [Pleurodeles waltl]
MGGPVPLEQENSGGPAGDGLPTWKGCPSHHDPSDVPDPGGGISGVGWALERITAATRGARLSRALTSTSATKSSSSVVPASPGTSKGAPIRAARLPPSEAKDHPIPPPAKVKKGPACRREKPHHPPSKASSRTKEDSAKVPAATSKVGKGHKSKGKSPQDTKPTGEGLVSPFPQDSPATCTTVSTAATTATCTAIYTATCMATASTTVTSSIPSGQPSEAARDGLVSPSTSADTCTTGSISAADTTAATATATCPAMCPASATTADISSIPSGQPSKNAGDGLVSSSTSGDTCTTGSISATDTPAATATCPATCPASATTADISSIPSGQPSEAAGDGLTLHTLHEAPPPALALPAVCSLSRRKEECGSASMEYHATCYR